MLVWVIRWTISKEKYFLSNWINLSRILQAGDLQIVFFTTGFISKYWYHPNTQIYYTLPHVQHSSGDNGCKCQTLSLIYLLLYSCECFTRKQPVTYFPYPHYWRYRWRHLPLFALNLLYNKIKLHGGLKIWILSSCGETLLLCYAYRKIGFSQLEDYQSSRQSYHIQVWKFRPNTINVTLHKIFF